MRLAHLLAFCLAASIAQTGKFGKFLAKLVEIFAKFNILPARVEKSGFSARQLSNDRD